MHKLRLGPWRHSGAVKWGWELSRFLGWCQGCKISNGKKTEPAYSTHESQKERPKRKKSSDL